MTAVTQESSRREFVRELWSGFSRPSLASVLSFLAVALGLMLATLVLVTEERMGPRVLRMLAHSESDDFAFVSARAAELARTPQRGPRVLFLGNSALQSALPDEELLAATLAEENGRPHEVNNLTMLAQSAWDQLVLADKVGRFDGVVVLATGHPALTPLDRDPPLAGPRSILRRPRLAFVSEALDQEARRLGVEPPRRTGAYVWDNRFFLIQRVPNLLRSLMQGALSQDYDRYFPIPPTPEAFWSGKVVQDIAASVPDEIIRHRSTMARVIQRFRQCGDVEVILLENPINPRLARDVIGAPAWEQRRQDMQRLADEAGARYWNLNRELDLDEDEYHLCQHLRSAEAQERYGKLLCLRIAPLAAERLPERGP